jgi:hypothetical protein
MSFSLAGGLCAVVLGRCQIQVREHGLALLEGSVLWQEIESYTWEAGPPGTSVLRLRCRAMFGKTASLAVAVPTLDRNTVANVLHRHAGDRESRAATAL